MTESTWLLLQLASTLPLTGLIAFVQFAHYPIFSEIDESSFSRYHSAYVRRVTGVVAPLMLLEVVGSIGWVVATWNGDHRALSWVGLFLVAVVWLSTHFLQVPTHQKLSERGPDPVLVKRLVQSNALRTVAWTLRSALLLFVATKSGAIL